MRRAAGCAAVGVGLIAAFAGLGLAVFLGPDGRRDTGPKAVDVDGSVIVTAPQVLSWSGITIHIDANVDPGEAVFIGLGNAVDVSDYVAEARYVKVTSYEHPWDIEHHTVEGRNGLPAAPTAVDWWIAHSGGVGGANFSALLPDETVQLAIVGLGGAELSGLRLNLAYSLPIGFWGSLGIVLCGVGVAFMGGLSLRGRRLWRGGRGLRGAGISDDEFVYVFVDPDGVEHELGASEAAQLGVFADTEPEIDGR